MFDIKALRENFDETKRLLSKRGKDYNLEHYEVLDNRRKELLKKTEEMKAKQNATSKQIPVLKKEGKDTAALMEEMKLLSDEIKSFEPALKQIEDEFNAFLIGIPNVPHETVPDGLTEAENVEVRRHGKPTEFTFEPLPHWDLGKNLGILDQDTAVKIAGSRFMMLRKDGARLIRALISFMLDTHSANGYEEIWPPYIANRASMTGTGQLPDKEEDMYHLTGTDYFLNPTAETPLTNIHRDEILDVQIHPSTLLSLCRT